MLTNDVARKLPTVIRHNTQVSYWPSSEGPNTRGLNLYKLYNVRLMAPAPSQLRSLSLLRALTP